MTKLYGAVCIACACALTCTYVVCDRKNKAEELNSILSLLRWMQAELEIRLTSIPELAAIASKECGGKGAVLMAELAKACADIGDDEFCCIWSACIGRTLRYMDSEARVALDELGRILGRYDADTQREEISHCIEKLNYCMEKENGKRSDSRCTTGTVFAVGAMIIILLI